jgi:hypothetical protein
LNGLGDSRARLRPLFWSGQTFLHKNRAQWHGLVIPKDVNTPSLFFIEGNWFSTSELTWFNVSIYFWIRNFRDMRIPVMSSTDSAPCRPVLATCFIHRLFWSFRRDFCQAISLLSTKAFLKDCSQHS